MCIKKKLLQESNKKVLYSLEINLNFDCLYLKFVQICKNIFSLYKQKKQYKLFAFNENLLDFDYYNK